MRLHFDIGNALVWAFVAIVAVSSVNMVYQTREYLLMYSSLDQLKFALSSIVLHADGQNGTEIIAQVWADNPVDYGGVTVTLVSLSTYLFSGQSSIFHRTPLVAALINQPLLPAARTVFSLTMLLNSQNTTSLRSFSQTNGPMITANSLLTATVTTAFLTALNAISASPIVYQEHQNLTLS